ncbi:3-hydroxyacyl-CoA dehydrogenase [Niveispirillum sp. KHB5.9]|uniref:3-hydroxyacyl-CoA dehydrogenase n=1 Tax=Niveispirillum sp. KHB5.9 TaxID=3400269 RepID=UPI003A85B9AF
MASEIIGVVGAGIMGRGIAQLFTQAGHTVRLHDSRDGAAGAAREFVLSMLDKLATKGAMSADDVRAAAGRLTAVAALEDLAGCTIVVEAIVEDLEAKRALFAALEGIVAEDCLLASNTSSLTVSAIAAGCRHPARVAGLHFFNPVPLMKLAEVIPGLLTAPAVTDRLLSLVTGTGHRAVRAADQPGFLVNHAGRALYTEGLRLLEEGVAPVADIDRALRDTLGFRMGPFELMDLTGLDVSGKVMQSIYEQFQQEPRYRPSTLIPPRLAAGLYGRKTGRGFYPYPEGVKQEPAEPPPPPAMPGTAWVQDGEGVDALRALLAAGGATLADDPAGADVLFTLPWGEDVTAVAVRTGLDARRLVGIDPLGGLAGRLVLMASPATDPALADKVHGWLAAAGRAVTRIQDSPGFIGQRVLAMIVNTGCEIAQRGIAVPPDIDAAVRLGLGYPSGPLEWGDRVGPAKVLAILERLLSVTGDPRYRPSPWLRRRALLGLSLRGE